MKKQKQRLPRQVPHDISGQALIEEFDARVKAGYCRPLASGPGWSQKGRALTLVRDKATV